jgi:hypothetical protein
MTRPRMTRWFLTFAIGALAGNPAAAQSAPGDGDSAIDSPTPDAATPGPVAATGGRSGLPHGPPHATTSSTKRLPFCSEPSRSSVARTRIVAVSKDASAQPYPIQSRSAYSIVLTGDAKRIPSW